MTNDTLRRGMLAVFSATVVVAAGTVFAKGAGLVKELYVAYAVGPSAELDAFLFAYVFPAILINVIGGAIQAALVPQYLETAAHSGAVKAAQIAGETASVVLSLHFIVMIVFIPLLMLLVPWLAGGFDIETRRLTQALIPVLMPLVVLSALSAAWAGLLNAHGRFAIAAFVPVCTPLAVVIALLLPLPMSPAFRMAMGTMSGAAVELLVVGACLKRIEIPLFRKADLRRVEFISMLKQFLPAVGSSLLMSATLLIDQIFAAHLPSGSVSMLSYGTRLTGVVGAILISAVSAIALPAFSRFAADRKYQELRRAFILASVVVAAVSIPVAALCSLAATQIVELLYLRGEFTRTDVPVAASIQALHAWHIPVYAVAILAVRGLAAMRATWLMLIGSVLNLGTDIAVNTLFVPVLGVAAIGLATTLMYMVSAAFLVAGLLWQLRVARIEAR